MLHKIFPLKIPEGLNNKTITKIEKESPVELQAIGIGHDVTKYYKNALTINRAEELGEVLLDELTKLFND